MNPGMLNQRIEVLDLNVSGKTCLKYKWEPVGVAWAKIVAIDKLNLFSKVGIGVKSFKFIIRKRQLTLHQAFRHKDKFYFLTDIKEIDRMYLEVTAAMIEPKLCTVKRTTTDKDEMNRPILVKQGTIIFPACLIEKYMGFSQQQPQNVAETVYVLVTPKAINLVSGDIVEIENNKYNTQIIHNLDEFKNEYEISIKRDI